MAPVGQQRFHSLDLNQANSCVKFRESQIARGHYEVHPTVLSRGHPVVSKDPDSCIDFRVIRRHDSALAGRDQLSGVEAKTTGEPDSAGWDREVVIVQLERRAEGTSGVLDE